MCELEQSISLDDNIEVIEADLDFMLKYASNLIGEKLTLNKDKLAYRLERLKSVVVNDDAGKLIKGIAINNIQLELLNKSDNGR